MLEAYVRVYKGTDESENVTMNQLFEIETDKEEIEESGNVLQWIIEPETGEMTCGVRLRHFNSGRLLQVTYYKDHNYMGQILTLADGKNGGLEEDGQGISSKKILRKGGRVQNYTFKFYNKTNGDELSLTRETVFNIRNTETKLYISTQVFSIQEEDSEVSEGEQPDQA